MTFHMFQYSSHTLYRPNTDYVNGMLIVCGQFRDGMWTVCDLAESSTEAHTLRGMWTVCGRYVVSMWTVYGIVCPLY